MKLVRCKNGITYHKLEAVDISCSMYIALLAVRGAFSPSVTNDTSVPTIPASIIRCETTGVRHEAIFLNEKKEVECG
jgi:hypothetical protein